MDVDLAIVNDYLTRRPTGLFRGFRGLPPSTGNSPITGVTKPPFRATEAFPLNDSAEFAGFNSQFRVGPSSYEVASAFALAAKLLSVDTLTEIPHSGVVVRISNCNVVAGARKMFEQMFHVSHSGSGRQALNNMMGRLSNNSPIVPTASGLGAERPCGLAKGIGRCLFGGSE
jgi:hypothetical protein